MKIEIQQRGGDKSSHRTIAIATKFFAESLMSKKMVNTLKVVIKMRSSKLDKNVLGDCSNMTSGSKASKTFVITLNTTKSLLNQLLTLAHEMVHVYQGATNKLQRRFWKSDRQWHVRWNGKEMGVTSKIPYNQRLWEIEARQNEEILFNNFSKSANLGCEIHNHNLKVVSKV